MELCVKFVPFNERTLNNIIQRKIWFSRIHEQNDLYETRMFGPLDPSKEIIDFLKDYLSNSRKKAKLMETIEMGWPAENDESRVWYERIIEEKDWNNQIGRENRWIYPMLIENIIYLSTGIFCASSIDVFKDTSAQLMFAYYASLNGLALIYSTKVNDIHKVEYGEINNPSFSDSHYINLMRGKGSNLIFLSKLEKWNHEKEYRFFGSPGYKSANDIGLQLQGIFYTSRIKKDNINTLKIINEKIYSNELFVNSVYKSYNKKDSPLLTGKENESVYSWLEKIKKDTKNINIV